MKTVQSSVRDGGSARSVAGVLSALLVAIGILGFPANAPGAEANCNTLAARIQAHYADAQRYESEVEAINAAGGGTPAQVAYYNA
jgi:hypothetical protein